MDYQQCLAITQQNGRRNPEAQYLITDFDTWILNPFWDGVHEHDFSEEIDVVGMGTIQEMQARGLI